MHDKANPKPFVPSISIYFLQEYPINILIPFRGSLPEDHRLAMCPKRDPAVWPKSLSLQ